MQDKNVTDRPVSDMVELVSRAMRDQIEFIVRSNLATPNSDKAKFISWLKRNCHTPGAVTSIVTGLYSNSADMSMAGGLPEQCYFLSVVSTALLRVGCTPGELAAMRAAFEAQINTVVALSDNFGSRKIPSPRSGPQADPMFVSLLNLVSLLELESMINAANTPMKEVRASVGR